MKRGGSQVHKTSSALRRSKYKTGSTVSTDNRTGRYGFEQITRKQSKKDTLGFSVFFDKKAFDINKPIMLILSDVAPSPLNFFLNA